MSLADEWFEEYLRRCVRGNKRQRVMRDRWPRHTDASLRREQAYDADTERCLAIIHADYGRRSGKQREQWERASREFMTRIGVAA